MPHHKAYSLSPYISVNGQLTLSSHTHLSYADRGFTLGDGVFETILVRGREALWLQDHVGRMMHGAQVLGMQAIPSLPPAEAILQWAQNLLQTIELPPSPQEPSAFLYSVLRITLTRGPSSQRGIYLAPENARPTVLMTLHPWAAPQDIRAVVAQTTRRNDCSPLSSIKSLGYADSILARHEALTRGANEALLLNTRDYLACASIGNLFLQIGAQWFTPTTECGILPGLARRRLLDVLQAKEVRLEPSCLSEVEAAFICNSLGASPILELEGRTLNLPSDWSAIESIYFE